MRLIWVVWVTKIESDLIASKNKKNLFSEHSGGRFFYVFYLYLILIEISLIDDSEQSIHYPICLDAVVKYNWNPFIKKNCANP